MRFTSHANKGRVVKALSLGAATVGSIAVLGIAPASALTGSANYYSGYQPYNYHNDYNNYNNYHHRHHHRHHHHNHYYWWNGHWYYRNW